jgi:membrane protein insertase Oxa1/YidC/SpoIIIJ
MRQTWTKAIHSLDTGILALSRFTFGKVAFAIMLLAVAGRILAIPYKIRLARQTRENNTKLKDLKDERQAIEEKYQPEPGQLASFEMTRQKGEELKQLYQKNRLSFSPGGMFLLSTLANIAATQAIGGIKKDGRFQEGGILWFKDLTRPDRFLVLPALLAVIQVARPFILPNGFNQDRASRLPGLERVERLAAFTRFLPVGFFVLPIIFKRQPSAAENIFAISQTGAELVEDYFIRKLITEKE